MHTKRILQKIKQTIDALKLDLKGKIVLTEAATGPYCVTPIIAALSGAEKVFAFTKPSKYGSIEDVINQTNLFLSLAPEMAQKIQIINNLTPTIISQADIITNSGHLRPLNDKVLKHVKKGCVVSLMYEAWEWREGDLDLNFCKKNNIEVGAINERHPDVDVFNYLGDMAIKQIFDAGLNPYKNKFILLCNNDFGPYIADTLSKNCSELLVIEEEQNKNKYQHLPILFSDTFYHPIIPVNFKNADAIIFSAYPFDKNWIGGKKSEINIDLIQNQLNTPFIIRFSGNIDETYCKNKINYYPESINSGHMGIIPSEIGFDPIIRLQSGGLKVGEALLNGNKTHNNVNILDIL